jgi:hypothetical protein
VDAPAPSLTDLDLDEGALFCADPSRFVRKLAKLRACMSLSVLLQTHGPSVSFPTLLLDLELSSPTSGTYSCPDLHEKIRLLTPATESDPSIRPSFAECSGTVGRVPRLSP